METGPASGGTRRGDCMTHSCLKCGHQWTSRVPNPSACPRCKRYDYDKPKPKSKGTTK